MLLVTDAGHYFTVVEDFDDRDFLWVRSQDKRSIQHCIAVLKARIPIPVEGVSYELVDEPTWDYQFRVKLTRELWTIYLEVAVEQLSAYKLKPAVADARGKDHPITKMVEDVFYSMSYNRPDGSKPGWVTGDEKAPK